MSGLLVTDADSQPNCVALIPARAGSKRVVDKNIRPLGGHPMMAYTISAAIQSGVFDAVVLSTDSEHYAEIGRHYGAEVPFLRPEDMAGSKSPDVEWVEFTLKELAKQGRNFDCFSILRPTSPFRQAGTIKRAWGEFCAEKGVDSLRAIEPCSQHPGKMWVVRGKRMSPLMPLGTESQPWHSNQYAALPLIHVQNASLEIAWSRMALDSRTIAGNVLMPFFTEGLEGFDINSPEDWWHCEHLVETGQGILPEITIDPFISQVS